MNIFPDSVLIGDYAHLPRFTFNFAPLIHDLPLLAEQRKSVFLMITGHTVRGVSWKIKQSLQLCIHPDRIQGFTENNAEGRNSVYLTFQGYVTGSMRPWFHLYENWQGVVYPDRCGFMIRHQSGKRKPQLVW
ncbi:MAG: hypothetical protein A2664_03045 [Candidatus Taylorbacteria bacterium RIFCSPHIGHO2_01_FULL_46_22b]|uniref:Uncharacterized protein n=1 Tax=Candidatus Taylorbacteria bacterium RIFCSPHIGHO2_01_FULL_46_22b TaxID=1802301 RepID=A0A1G2M3W4_9BACT|nr:MAG: hypothetical protein A2664_03045 [Candidatus Taylorbacteria bacterium RIFCSPHIGHO2_01_FULL_46_22b]